MSPNSIRKHRIRRSIAALIEQLEIRTCLAAVGPDAYGYVADAVAFENINLTSGGAGVFAIPLTNVDDDSVPVDLSTNTFRFYGSNFTGNNQLFVSSNGLITFGSADSDFSNSDLTNSPSERAIAPLWDDYIQANSVLGKFENTDADPENDRLIIQWNTFHIESDPRDNPIVFQAILQLNTGATEGDITFNYVDLNTGATNTSQGATATVGIKDLGSTNHLAISVDSINALVGDGKAVKITLSNIPVRLSGDGTLTINGNETPDSIGITSITTPATSTSAAVTSLRVRLNTDQRLFDIGDVQRLVIAGKGGNDLIDWSSLTLDAFCDAGDGDDLVLAGAGNDTITGGNGNDRIAAGDGADVVAGNAQADKIDGGLGKDLINGHGGRDKLTGGGANDTIHGGASGDFIAGQGGPDLLLGEGGADRISGGIGAGDILGGGAGDDILISNDSFVDSLFGDAGNDTSIADSIDILVSVENQT